MNCKMKKTLKIFTFSLLSFALGTNVVFASTTDGIIDSNHKYAWSENLGWVNFAPDQGDIHVTDAGLTGYAWGNRFGWINLAPTNSGQQVINNSEGQLSGYAWASRVGWINFQHVIINASGKFTGYAFNSQTGKITFDCNSCNVTTDWRPSRVRAGTATPIAETTTEAAPVALWKVSSVNFSGKAYPGAHIFLVEKVFEQDSLVRQGIAVEDNGKFKLGDIPTGFHAYSLMVKDKVGRQAHTKVYDMKFINDPLTVDNILVPPTVEVARGAVTKGDFIKVVGSAFPRNHVAVQIDLNKSYSTEADDAGDYSLLISTAGFGFGSHQIRVNQNGSGTTSDWSPTRNFIVSASTVVNADLSGDGKVNIKDWSIFLGRWKQATPENEKLLDLNKDGKIDVSDLGIFLRALRM